MDISSAMQEQAKALADPSRFRLFEHIANTEEPSNVADLTELLGFNHNAVRQHLAILVGSGLIAEKDEKRQARGRPRKQYTLRADALSAFSSVSGSYERLAALLLTTTTSKKQPYEIGYEVGSETPIAPDNEPLTVLRQLAEQLREDGFEPKPATKGYSIMLQHCPFANVAAEDPSIVCELHRGLIDGYLSVQSGPINADLQLSPPHKGGCRVSLEAALHSTPQT